MTTAAEIDRRVRMFEFYVRHIWPLHRKLVPNAYARRCRRCIASEKMVPLQRDGVCDLCHQSNPTDLSSPTRTANAAELTELHALLVATQGSGSAQYDALVLYSGGKDSTYMIRRLQNDYPGLRILAMTIHNGFMSPVALENIDDLIEKLNVDHVLIRPPLSFYVRLFRYCLTHLNKDGSYGTVDFSDGEFLLDSARHLALEKQIPLILAGYSRYQVQNGLHLNTFESPRHIELSDRTHTAGIALADIFDKPDIQRWWHGSRHPPVDVARLLFPLYAWDLEESEIVALVRSWGLMSTKSSSPIATNHQLIPLLGVVDVHQFGFSSFEYEFCRMIREGKARKEDWQHIFEFLEYTAKSGLFVKPVVLDLSKKLGVTLDDLGIRFGGA